MRQIFNKEYDLNKLYLTFSVTFLTYDLAKQGSIKS